MFMTVKQAAEKWGISDRRVRTLCAEDRIPGAYRSGRSWVIPADAVNQLTGGTIRRSLCFLKLIRKRSCWISADL